MSTEVTLYYESNYFSRPQVTDLDESAGEVHLKFLQTDPKQKGFFSWPVKEDYGWEPLSSLRDIVQLQFVPEKSTNRKQVYKAETSLNIV